MILEKTKGKENFEGGNPVVNISPCKNKEKNKTLENRKQGGIPADPPSPSRHGRTSGSQLPLRNVYISPHTSTTRLLRLSENHL